MDRREICNMSRSELVEFGREIAQNLEATHPIEAATMKELAETLEDAEGQILFAESYQ